jgi:transketolase
MDKFDPRKLRKTVLDMAFAGSSVHIGCAFSIIELLSVLYRSYLGYPGNDPNAPMRDYLVLSKGHGVMAQYACMKELGWLHDDDIRNYFADGTELKGLSDSRVDGLEVTSGSMGHGLSVGVGLALGAKMNATDQKVYALVGDGEINEGPIWEAVMFAAHHDLNNLLLIVDQNGFQAMGKTNEIIRLGNLQRIFEAFGFQATTIDGHDRERIDQAIAELWASTSRSPKAIIAETVKGKGVSFMENNNAWHYTRLDVDTYNQALAELRNRQ